jgi:hypothetical protein
MRLIPSCVLGLVLNGLLLLSPGQAGALCHRRDCCAPPPPPPPPKKTVVLEVCHPRTCCKLEVPVCIPCCCDGAPCVRFEHTCLGAGKSVFTWACGYQVTIRYTCFGGVRVVQRN